MAEDSESLQPEGEVVDPKPEDPPSPVAAAAGTVAGQPSVAAAFPSVSIKIWPPTQRTRDAVILRLVENLSTPSILSKRYGTLPPDEASDAARLIEQEAFAFASASAPSSAAGDDGGRAEASVDEGIEILQIYSKEISRRMLEAIKARAPSASPAAAAPSGGPDTASAPAPVAPTGEEISSGEPQNQSA
ncbi:MFP1 attachment factor 1 [Apostasia shenzhenica]|uniref:MFP1 attachment factor 1 n=1 Tax=Apostasia shenzhenica TaxID=1088818 RepID=A0A2I0ARI1_9ASPA|nr:MFP1 attachment factor 1 [Apostasia shenzhenica]